MKEEMIRLHKHYKKISETASGAIAKNALLHMKEVELGHPYVIEPKEIIKSKGKK